MRQVLLLNSSYEPLGVLDWQAAVTGLHNEKFVLVEEYDQVIRSAHTEMRLPAVIKTREYVRKPVKDMKFSRVNVYARDNYQCQYCSKHCSTDELTYDHVVPRSRGGKTDWLNIVSCCYGCNARKGGRTPAEAKMKLLSKPVRPRAVPNVEFKFVGRNVPEQWADYIQDCAYWTDALDED